MKGTKNWATAAILLIPPSVTNAASRLITAALRTSGISKAILAESTMAFTCGKVPIPKRATLTPKKAKAVARTRLYFFLPARL